MRARDARVCTTRDTLQDDSGTPMRLPRVWDPETNQDRETDRCAEVGEQGCCEMEGGKTPARLQNGW